MPGGVRRPDGRRQVAPPRPPGQGDPARRARADGVAGAAPKQLSSMGRVDRPGTPALGGENSGENSARRRAGLPADRHPGGSDGRPVAPQAAARTVPPRLGRLHPWLPHHRGVAGRHRRGRLPRGGARRARPVLGPQGERGRLGGVRRHARLRVAVGRRGRAHGCCGAGQGDPAGRDAPRALSQRAPERRAVGRQPAARGRPDGAGAHHHGKAVRDGPCDRAVAERPPARGLRRGPDLPH